MSGAPDAAADRHLESFLRALSGVLGPRLTSVVLYGSAARGDFGPGTSDLNLLVVIEDLERSTLEAIAPAIAEWTAQGQPPPRLFTPSLLAGAVDVFPMELLDIQAGRRVLRGGDPFATLVVPRQGLRLQCERELREKLMRLQEGYVDTHASSEGLRLLLSDSYTTFAALLRGCLRLYDVEPPSRNTDAVALFCEHAGIDRMPFEEVEALRRGAAPRDDLKALYSRYHEALARVIDAIDRMPVGEGGRTR